MRPLHSFLHLGTTAIFQKLCATAIGFDLPASVNVRLAIYDVRGRLVCRLVDGRLRAGEHAARWNGRDVTGRVLADGVYFARLTAAGSSVTTRLVLVR